MLTRREFSIAPNVWLVLAVFIALTILFVLSVVAVSVHVVVIDDRTAAERGFLVAFGWSGIPVFGGAAFFLASFLTNLLKRKRWIALVLDEQAFTYSGLKVAWPLIRETFVYKQIGRSYVAVRTINDRAIANKMDEILGKRLPYMFLFGLHYRQWRAQCAIVIPAMEGVTALELQQIMEEYRKTYGSPQPPQERP